MSIGRNEKVQKIIPGEEAGDLLYSEEPKGRHAEDAGKDGYLVIGTKKLYTGIKGEITHIKH